MVVGGGGGGGDGGWGGCEGSSFDGFGCVDVWVVGSVYVLVCNNTRLIHVCVRMSAYKEGKNDEEASLSLSLCDLCR